MAMRGGDDLQDDFVPDNTVALPGEEGEGDQSGFGFSGFYHQDDHGPGPAEGSYNVNRSNSGASDTSSPEDVDVAATSTSAGTKRKRKSNAKKKVKKQKLAAARSADDADEILAARTPIELAQYLSAMQAKTFTKMSALELEDLRIPVDAIADTTIWSGPRTGDKIGEFIVKVLPALWLRLGQKPKNKGAPTLIYVVGAALRAADLTRCLRAANLRGTKGGDVAKLFAKHFKITDQATYLSRTLIGSAVGTPGRIGKLLNMDALSTSALSHIILDTSYRDAKKRNLLDIPETRDELFVQVLSYPKILRGLKEGKMQVVFF